jgi:hypothetical protein
MHSRDIARCCDENVMFMGLSADTKPHFTTIAHFISSCPSIEGNKGLKIARKRHQPGTSEPTFLPFRKDRELT